MKSLTKKDKSLIGMVHVQALPGTPFTKLSMKETGLIAVSEAQMLRDAGFDAIMIENMHDVPYLNRHVGPEITAAMTYVAAMILEYVDLPLGIQILAGANKEAFAAAHVTGCSFIRAEGFVFSHVADEGIMQSDAGELLRYRKHIGADQIKIFTDIKKKHSSHAITSDINVSETAHAAEFFGSDGIIITGTKTGEAPLKNDLTEAKGGVNIPVLIGSGITPENLPQFWNHADAFIIGSYIKENGFWKNPMDHLRLKRMVSAAEALRNKPKFGS